MKISHLCLVCCGILGLVACVAPATGTPSPTAVAIPILHEDVPQASLTTSAAAVEAGQTIVVTVDIADVADLFGVELHLKFNPVFLEVVDMDAATEGIQIAHGDFFAPDFMVQNQADNITGAVTYVGLRVAPTPPVTGSGTLATLVLRGKAKGPLDLALTQVLLSTPDGEAIPVEIIALNP